MKRKIASLSLSLVLVAGLILSARAAHDVTPGLQRAADFYGGYADTWADAIALYSAGSGQFSYGGGFDGAMADFTRILVCLAAGIDIDLTRYSAELAAAQNKDGSFGASIYDTVYSMLALNKTHTYDKSRAFAWLEAQQLEDGGFAYFGDEGDVDTTAIVLLVLRGDAALKAHEFLLSSMTAGYGFVSSWSDTKAENACSLAMVISGFTAAGFDVPEQMAESLFSYQLADGSFCYEAGGESDVFATQQALTALGDYQTGVSVFERLPKAYFADSAKISPYAAAQVGLLYEKGIMVGSGGFFRPQATVTRAECAVLMARVGGISGAGLSSAFSDVPGNAWFAGAVAGFEAMGIFDSSSGFFLPYKPVTREDFAYLLTAALGLVPQGNVSLTDRADISPSLIKAVEAVVSEGLMPADENGCFAPLDLLTREQAAVILARVYA